MFKPTLNKSILASVILLALLMTSIYAALPVKAQEVDTHGGPPGGGYEGPTTIPAGQTADFTIQDLAFLSVSPNPIGVGQTALVNMWITFPSGEGKYMTGYKVTITRPDGTTEDVNLKSYVADGTSWFQFVPQTAGEYKFKFSFAGEYFPAGYYRDGKYSESRTGDFASAIFNPSVYCAPAESRVVTLTVQTDFVLSWSSALPTDYWSRPIQPNNREWNVIAGNYPWNEANVVGVTGNAWHDNYYGPFIPAVNTPHIVWKSVNAMSGIIGGETGQYSMLTGPGTPSVIYMGRCYQTVTKMTSQLINGTYRQIPALVATCYDLRTGQTYYDIPINDGGITPTHIAYWRSSDTAVPGAGEAAGYTVELHTISGGRLYKVNPLTGAITANISLPTFSGNGANIEIFYRDGFYYSFQGINTTTATPATNITVTTSYGGFFIKWSEQGTSTNFTSRIESNVSVILPLSYRTIYQTSTYGNVGAGIDYESMISVQQHRFIYGGFYGSFFTATDLTTGRVLWNITTPVSSMESAYRPTNEWVRHGRYIAEMERGYLQAWDLRTGKELWKCEIPDWPWGEFWMYDEAAYNDLIFATGYTGVWAINETTGTVAWHYVDPAIPFETPYTSQAINGSNYAVQDIRVIGDKVYVSNNEHTPTMPATRGWGMFCLDANTGAFQWKLSGTRMVAAASADGYLTAGSSYDGTMYVLGKSPSKTTVSAPQTAITQGGSIVITGTVLDQALAAPDTPCVADESMGTWMDYLHLQMPIDGIYHNVTIKGVPVSLDAVDPNGNYVHIGDTTSDMSGTFSFMWTPDNVGKYTVMATFKGSNAYGSSYGETAIGVVNAPAVTPTPTATPIVQQPVELYIAGSTIAIIIAIALVGLMLRKRA
jgi:hypothetical protein